MVSFGLYNYIILSYQYNIYEVYTRQQQEILLAYLNTAKRLSDFGSVLHFEQRAQVASSVVKLNLKAFVSKCHFTVVRFRNK